jgi:GxxExxY protein
MLQRELTNRIIRQFYNVYNELGYGFLERVYENALVIALRDAGFVVEQQVRIDVHFYGIVVGKYIADLLVDEKVLLEIKATEGLRPEHEAQLTNYLRATKYEVGLLLNFGKNPQFSRRVFSNSRKKHKTTY